MASLLQICQEACENIDGLNVPTTIFNNEDPTAILLKTCALRTGRELVRMNWQALLTPTSFTTSNGVSQYSKPADFKRFADETFYNITQFRMLYGPFTPRAWADMTRSASVSVTNYSFRVAGGYIELSPTPTGAEDIGYDYYSGHYCTNAAGTLTKENWSVDSDQSRLPADLFIMGVHYRVLKAKGLPFDEDKADYLAAVESEIWDDTPKSTIDVSGVPRTQPSNIPSSNWG